MHWICSKTGEMCPIRLGSWYDEHMEDRYKDKCSCGEYKNSDMYVYRDEHVAMVENCMCRYYGQDRSKFLAGSDWVDK